MKHRFPRRTVPAAPFRAPGLLWRLAAALLMGGLCARMAAPGRADVGGARRALGLSPPAVPPITKPRRDAGLGLSSDGEDRAALAKVVEADRFAADGHWPNAAGRLQEVLDRHPEALLAIGPGAYWPAWRYGTLRLLSGPPDMLAAYRSAYGDAARAALEAAREARSAEALRRVARRYGATAAGQEALDLLAALHLERGRANLAARELLLRLRLAPEDAEVPANTLAKLAVALARSGRRAQLERLAAFVAGEAGEAEVQTAAGAVPLDGFVRSLLDAVPGGPPSASRGALPRAVRPGTLLWQIRLSEAPKRHSRTPSLPPAPAPRLAASAPVVHEGVLYCQTPQGLLAIDPLSGEVTWRSDSPPWPSVLAARVLGGQRAAWRGNGVLASAPVSFPTRAVAFAYPTSTVVKDPAGGRRSVRSSRLDVLSLARPGAALWSAESLRADEAGARDPLALRFTTPPASADVVVCIGAWSDFQGTVHLLGYDSATGRLLWQTPVSAEGWLGAHPEGVLPDGSPPVARDGIAYFCSDAGTVAAIDAADGSILWLARYADEPDTLCRLETIGDEATVVTPPPNPPVLVGDSLFVLPADSPDLVALDAATGQTRWRRKVRGADPPGREPDMLHLLDADAERVILSGAAVLCLNARDGTVRWRSVPLDAFPAGRGRVTRDFVMCPIEGSVAMIDVAAEGRLAEPVHWKPWRQGATAPVGSGNLAVFDWILIVARDDSISAFACQDADTLLAERAAREPGEPTHLLHLGWLHLKAENWSGAIDCYARAMALAGPSAEAARRGLSEAHRGLALELESEEAWAGAAEAFGRALALEEGVTSRAALIAAGRAAALEKAGQVEAALAAWHDVMARFGDVDVTLPDRRTLTARLLAAVRVGGLIRRHGRELYAAHDEQARAAARDAPDDRAAFETLSRSYPNATALADLRLARAEAAAAAGRRVTAEGELLAISRLSPGYRADEIAELRRRLAVIRPKEPKRSRHAAPYQVVWRQKGSRRFVPPEALADADAIRRGEPTDDHLLVARGKSLLALRIRDGSPAWAWRPGWLGVRLTDPVAGPGHGGVEVLSVLKGQPSEKAGLQPGDALLSFDGHPTDALSDLIQVCGTTPPGKEVELVVLRDGRRLVLRATIVPRPREPVVGGVPLGPVNAHERLRVVGLDGDVLLAEIDLVLLWLDRNAGKLLRRAILGRPVLRQGGPVFLPARTLLARGIPPVARGGSILASTPDGHVVCLNADGSRRWSVRLTARNAPDLAVAFDATVCDGVAAVLSAPVGNGLGAFEPDLFLFDLFSGERLLRHRFDVKTGVGLCRLVPAGDKLLVVASGSLHAFDVRGPRPTWSVRAGEAEDGLTFGEVRVQDGVVLALVEDLRVVASDLETGRTLWRSEPPGRAILRLICTEDERHGPVVVCPREEDGRYLVTCYRLSDGERLWETVVAEGVRLGSRGHAVRVGGNIIWRARNMRVPFAGVDRGRLFLVQHFHDPNSSKPLATIIGLRLSDGALLARPGTAGAAPLGRYNVFGGKLRAGMLGLITEQGWMGLWTGEP